MEDFTIIRIKEKNYSDQTFSLQVTIRDTDGSEEESQVSLTDPFDHKKDALFEWYFEEYISKPYDDTRKLDAIKAISDYGRDLFRVIFSGNIDFRYRVALQNGGPEKIIIEVIGDSPEFQRIYWESLHDPDRDLPLATKGVVFIRKNISVLKVKAVVKPSSTLNLLIVTARPNEESDVNYRTIQRPLVDMVENTDAPVLPHILRPGTYEALVKHLDGKAGYYHIIHFDLHGSLLDYETYDQLYTESYGLTKVEQSEFNGGDRAFIFFESHAKGQPVAVEASQLASLLEDKQIPICILNACQSAKQSNSMHETSLGRFLIQKGIQAIVAMRYSVSVSAAKIMMETLYDQLYKLQPAERAVVAARRELHRKKKREANYNYTIELEDWLLPVIYQNGRPSLALQQPTADELTQFYRKQRIPEAVELSLPYGFYGRDLDILKIEKIILLRSNILLLQGMGGAGKTTLLKYLSAWWLRTGFIQSVFYFGYDIKAYTLNEIIYTIAQSIYSAQDYALFTSLQPDIQADRVIKTLRSNRYALILDNTESITGEKLAIPNTLPEKERALLKKFIARLKDGETAVIIGSRSNEEWLKEGTFGQNRYILEGLDEESATHFAHDILQSLRLPVNETIADSKFEKLMSLLSGYPLAIKAILPNLKSKTAAAILKDIEEGIGDIDKGNIQQRTESIIKCIEYSHSNLSEDAQYLLSCLAPFQTIVNVTPGFILTYFAQVTQIDNDADFVARLDNVIEEAVRNGFMQSIDANLSVKLMGLQPVFTYFLRNRLSAQDTTMNERLQRAFVMYYQVIAQPIYKGFTNANSQEALPWLYLMHHEYNNFYKVLTILMGRKERVQIVFSILEEFLDRSDRQEERIALGEMLYENIKGVTISQMDEVMQDDAPNILIRIADIYRESKRYDHAINIYNFLLSFYADRPKLAIKKNVGIAYQDLAITHLERGMPGDNEQCIKYCEEALKRFGKEDDYLIAHVNRNMGHAYHSLKNNKVAKEYMYKAHETYKKKNSFRDEGIVHQNLALLAESENDFDTFNAESMLAIECFKKANAWLSIAQIYMNLGVWAFRQENYEAALFHLRQGLNLFVQYNSEYNEAVAYLNLGAVHQNMNQVKEAKSYYIKALNILRAYPEAVAPIIDILRNTMDLLTVTPDPEFEKEVMQIIATIYGGNPTDSIEEWLNTPPEQ